MPEVIVYYAPTNSRSKIVADAMFAGIKNQGERVQLASSLSYKGPKSKTAIFYGWAQGLRKIFDDYSSTGRRAIYIDLGYWGRRKRTRFDGYHKFCLNSRHPTGYFQNRPKAPARFRALGLDIKPWRKGGSDIIIAGMSAKAAAAEGFQPNQWERAMIARLRKITDRPLIYRPKPNWLGAKPLPGTIFQKDVDIETALRQAHAVVTHHSNVGIDALIAGVPVFSQEGAASVLAEANLGSIDEPWYPDGREQFCHDLAWTQFSVDEMRSGYAWRSLKAEGIV